MSRALNDLADLFRPLACELIARASEHGVPVMIINTRRTEAEQAVNMMNGTSAVKHSKHQDGLAIDICPYAHYDLHGPDKLQWDSSDPAWDILGAIGEGLGLRWGGRWRQPHDPGHFEYVPPAAAPVKVTPA
jgi:hypothetical protein